MMISLLLIVTSVSSLLDNSLLSSPDESQTILLSLQLLQICQSSGMDLGLQFTPQIYQQLWSGQSIGFTLEVALHQEPRMFWVIVVLETEPKSSF